MFKFPSGVHHPDSLKFTEAGLIRALFFTGRASNHQWGSSTSAWEWQHRLAMTRAYVSSDPSSRLVRSKLAQSLDPSEKAYLSYFLGQALTAIFCEKVLDVTHLLHIHRYAPFHNVAFDPTTGQRPDLFGRSPAGWVVAEAKGRSNGMESKLRSKMNAQKLAVLTVNGSTPWKTVGCVAMFPAPDHVMTFSAYDPEKPSPTAQNFEIDMDRFTLAYYQPFLQLLDSDHSTDVSDDDERASATLAGTGVTIGLVADLKKRVELAVPDKPGGPDKPELKGLSEAVTKILDANPGKQFPDGSFFETSWGNSLSLDSEPLAVQIRDSDQGRSR